MSALKDLWNEESVAELIKSNGDFNECDIEGNSPLHWAAMKGDVGIVKILLDHGAKLEARCRNGHTALMFAVVKDRKEIVDVLLAGGADIKAKSNVGVNSLLYAVANGSVSMVKNLLCAGADPKYVNHQGTTLLDSLKQTMADPMAPENYKEIYKLLEVAVSK